MTSLYSKIFLFFLLFSFQAFAETIDFVAVGEAELEQEKVAIPDAFVKDLNIKDRQKLIKIAKTIKNDFRFYKERFHVPNLGFSHSIGAESSAQINFDRWKKAGFSYVITLVGKQSSVGQSFIAFSVYSTHSKKKVNSKLIPIAGQAKKLGHELADAAYQSITGSPSIFLSELVMVCETRKKGSYRQKELFVMDFDGDNQRRLTSHASTVLSPSMSHDKSKILYSLVRKKNRIKNVDLFLYDRKTRKSRLVSYYKGINSGAVFLPNDEDILLTLSESGNADIFLKNLNTGKMRQITKHYAVDVDPSVSPDLGLMTFLSNRSGKAHVYTGDPSGREKKIKRISFVGKFNASPRFSPDGKEIVFSSWVDNRFDIYRIDSSGRQLFRLTKDFGSNEEPSYSPDGQFIAFSSKRVLSRTKAVQGIYIMTRNGDVLGQISKKDMNCQSSRWSK